MDWSDDDADGEVLWALTDNLGSVRDVVDSSGELRIHRRFDAFGNIVDETHYNASGTEVSAGQAGYVDEAFAFTGRLFDKATGLQNNLNRWYDPSIGRWLSEDPIGLGPDANPYRYVGNSPINFTDPSGQQPPPQFVNVGAPPTTPAPPGSNVFDLIGDKPIDRNPWGLPNWLIPPSPAPSFSDAQCWGSRHGPDWKYEWPEPQNFIEEEIRYWERVSEGKDILEGLRQYNNRANCPRPITYSVSR